MAAASLHADNFLQVGRHRVKLNLVCLRLEADEGMYLHSTWPCQQAAAFVLTGRLQIPALPAACLQPKGIAFIDRFAYKLFEAEVRDALLQKIK